MTFSRRGFGRVAEVAETKVPEAHLACEGRLWMNHREIHEVWTFSTDPELDKLQRGFAAGAVLSQTQYIFSVCKKGSYLSGSFVKTRSARNAQSFALGRTNV